MSVSAATLRWTSFDCFLRAYSLSFRRFDSEAGIGRWFLFIVHVTIQNNVRNQMHQNKKRQCTRKYMRKRCTSTETLFCSKNTKSLFVYVCVCVSVLREKKSLSWGGALLRCPLQFDAPVCGKLKIHQNTPDDQKQTETVGDPVLWWIGMQWRWADFGDGQQPKQ